MSRVAVVTGANRGLGYATAEHLARDGYRVVLTGRSEKKAADAAGTLRASDLDVVSAVCDVGTDHGVASFAAWLGDEVGQLDVLVNNAGVIIEPSAASPLDVSAGTVADTFNNNSISAYRMLQALWPMLRAGDYARVVNVSSGMGALSDMGGGYPAYRMSKSAMNAVTRFFHSEARGNMKINSVCPGWVRTDMGGASATRSIDEGIAGIVWAATLPDDGPSGGFFRDGKPIDW